MVVKTHFVRCYFSTNRNDCIAAYSTEPFDSSHCFSFVDANDSRRWLLLAGAKRAELS